MRPMTNDATTALLRAIRMNFMNFTGLTFDEIRSRSWASATFAGARHELVLRLEGEGAEVAADVFVAGLEAAEFKPRGHIVADIILVSRERAWTAEGQPRVRLAIEALTVEDD